MRRVYRAIRDALLQPTFQLGFAILRKACVHTSPPVVWAFIRMRTPPARMEELNGVAVMCQRALRRKRIMLMVRANNAYLRKVRHGFTGIAMDSLVLPWIHLYVMLMVRANNPYLVKIK